MKSGHFLIVALLLGWIVFPATVLAQSGAVAPTPPTSTLIEQQNKGEWVFLQRCSVCHLPKMRKKPLPTFGPSLSGLLKNDKSPNKEKVVRLIILNGGPKMPGFQYGLEPKEIDDLIAYLKTL